MEVPVLSLEVNGCYQRIWEIQCRLLLQDRQSLIRYQSLADALSDDIHYKLSDNMFRGASDTYFSGKILARLGRVIVIASEMNKLAAGDIEDGMYTDVDDASLSLSMEAAAAADLPSDDDIANSVEQLKARGGDLDQWKSRGTVHLRPYLGRDRELRMYISWQRRQGHM